ncbi:polyketide synthase [Fusarium acutatum]|uniref:Polyketide synthase n=1 Tax=Fusarium acutatum TaxID=78861 RepID=A0A8H4J893_9HYPO|nr:polyketide synthase [Fusarium acutatum]
MPQTLITTRTAQSRRVHTEGAVHIEYRVLRPNGNQWVGVPALVEATADRVEWQAVETHRGLLWIPLPNWEAVDRIPSTTARPTPLEQDHEVGTVVDVLSGEDETQADIDRGLLPDRDQNPYRFVNLLADLHQDLADDTVPGANPWRLHAELEEARRSQSPGQDSSDSSITSLPSSPRQRTGGVDCFPVPELHINTHTWHTAYSDALTAYLQKHPQYYLLEPCKVGTDRSTQRIEANTQSVPSRESGEVSPPDNMTKHIIRLQGPDGEYRETIEAGPSPGLDYSISEMMDEERWLMESPPLSQESSAQEQDDSISSSTSVFNLSQYRDYQGKEISVHLIGEQTNALWQPQKYQALNDNRAEDCVDGWRKPAAPIVVFPILPRASIAPICASKDASRRAAAEKLLRPSTDNHGNENVCAVVVGRSATDLQTVVMVRPESAPTQTDNDNVDAMQLQTIMNKPCGRQVIWSETMMIPGNLEFTMKGLSNQLTGEDKSYFLNRVIRGHKALVAHDISHTCSYNSLPSQEDDKRKPHFREIHGGRHYARLHFQLRWPPMSVLTFPEEMIKVVKTFLEQHSNDAIPLNIALAAIIIYFDLEKLQCQNEGFFESGMEPVEDVPLAVFVCYFPHMLRFVELNHLTAFINPMRFALENYRIDSVAARKFRIDCTEMHSLPMRQLYAQIGSSCPQIPPQYRVHLTPASMPGTEMVFPLDSYGAAEPTTNNFAFCLLNDIRTLGLPLYRRDPNSRSNKMMKLGGPRWIFPETIGTPSVTLSSTPTADYWIPESKASPSALTGRAFMVGPLFKDIKGVTPSSDRTIAIATYTLDVDLERWVPHDRRFDLARKSEELYRVAAYKGVKLGDLRTCPNTLTPTWRGKEEHLAELYDNGSLKRVIEQPIERAPPVKRAKFTDNDSDTVAEIPSEPKLPEDYRKEILALIEPLKCRSAEWAELRTACESNDVTLSDVQQCMGKIKSFLSDVDDAFKANGNSFLSGVISVMVRAAGYYNAARVGQGIDKREMERLLQRFKHDFDGEVWNTMGLLDKLRLCPDAADLLSPNLKRLLESDLITSQRQAFAQLSEKIHKPS